MPNTVKLKPHIKLQNIWTGDLCEFLGSFGVSEFVKDSNDKAVLVFRVNNAEKVETYTEKDTVHNFFTSGDKLDLSGSELTSSDFLDYIIWGSPEAHEVELAKAEVLGIDIHFGDEPIAFESYEEEEEVDTLL